MKADKLESWTVRLPVTNEERRAIKLQAQSAGLSIGDYVADCMRKMIATETRVVELALRVDQAADDMVGVLVEVDEHMQERFEVHRTHVVFDEGTFVVTYRMAFAGTLQTLRGLVIQEVGPLGTQIEHLGKAEWVEVEGDDEP